MYKSILLIAAGMILVGASTGKAQQIHLPPAISQSQGMGSPPVTSSDRVQREQAAAANAQRQVEIRRDTDKMAELTEELKEYLAKNDHVMSIDAIKKVEQIEKLAHGVKGKMKQSFWTSSIRGSQRINHIADFLWFSVFPVVKETPSRTPDGVAFRESDVN